MIQFYALSVFCNILTGLLVATEPGEGKGRLGELRKLLDDNSLKFSLGIASVVIAFFKLLSPTEGDVPIVGDLLPVLAGFSAGGVLLFDFFRGSSKIQSPTVDKLQSGILSYRRYIGYGAAAIGLLHFLIPTVPIF